jgi:hypothetical protein
MSLTFKKNIELANSFDRTSIEFTTDAVTLPDILEDFTSFLKAVGFIIPEDHQLTFIHEEDL